MFEVGDKRETHRVAFVIGADGAYSKVREQMQRVVRCVALALLQAESRD